MGRKKKIQPPPTKNEWISLLEDDFLTFMENLDECFEGVELPEDVKKRLEQIAEDHKLSITTSVNTFEIEPEMIFKQDGLMDNLLDTIYYSSEPISKEGLQKMVDIASEQGCKGYFIKSSSIAEDMKIEALLHLNSMEKMILTNKEKCKKKRLKN